jgi:hypothetical protein
MLRVHSQHRRLGGHGEKVLFIPLHQGPSPAVLFDEFTHSLQISCHLSVFRCQPIHERLQFTKIIEYVVQGDLLSEE